MKIILCIAQQKGLYKREDYSQNNKDYCGTKITNTPLKCKETTGKFKCNTCEEEIKKWLKTPI